MVIVELNKIISKSTMKVLHDISEHPNDTFRERQKRLSIALNAIKYHCDKLLYFGVITRNNGKYENNVKCPYCSETKICKGSYPEGCFLDHELTHPSKEKECPKCQSSNIESKSMIGNSGNFGIEILWYKCNKCDHRFDLNN